MLVMSNKAGESMGVYPESRYLAFLKAVKLFIICCLLFGIYKQFTPENSSKK